MLKALVLTTALALPLAPALAQQAEPGPDTLAERVGATVYSPTGEPLAELTDVVATGSGDAQAILSYGGLLGMGETEVAVPPRELSVQPGGEGGQPRLVLSMGEDELKAMPPYDAKQEQAAAAVAEAPQVAETAPAPVPAPAASEPAAAPDDSGLGTEAQQAVSQALDEVDQAWSEVQGATTDGWASAQENFRQAVSDLERTWEDVTAEEQQAERPAQ